MEDDNKEELEDNKDDKSENEDEDKEELPDKFKRTRSGRISRLVHKYVTTHHNHLLTQAIKKQEHTIETARIIARTMTSMNYQFAQTFSLNKGIKEFGNKGYQAAHKKIKQLHNRIVFKPILIEKLTSIKKRRALESLIFVTEN